MKSLCIILPVHNRGILTANYLSHLKSIMPPDIMAHAVLFDDGCTDLTVQLACSVFQDLEVITLSGYAYWGGAINSAIDYVKSAHLRKVEYEYYMIANDDIRYYSALSFSSAFEHVNPTSLVCACYTMSDNRDLVTSKVPDYSEFGVFYDDQRGVFGKASFENPPNVSSTYSLISTVHPWLESEYVPRCIPHYLSDYWFTYRLNKAGYKIIHPPTFGCIVNATTTKNSKPSKDEFKFSPKKFGEKGYFDDIFSQNLAVTSPSYLPAWICFLSVNSNSYASRYRLFMLVAKYISLRFLQILLPT